MLHWSQKNTKHINWTWGQYLSSAESSLDQLSISQPADVRASNKCLLLYGAVFGGGFLSSIIVIIADR